MTDQVGPIKVVISFRFQYRVNPAITWADCNLLWVQQLGCGLSPVDMGLADNAVRVMLMNLELDKKRKYIEQIVENARQRDAIPYLRKFLCLIITVTMTN